MIKINNMGAATLLAALTAVVALLIIAPASAGADDSRFVRLGLNKSMVIRLPTATRDVLLGNPAIVDAVVRTQNTAYLFAKSVGQTNAFFFDAEGRQILSLDIEVALDGKALQKLISRAIPGSRITVDTVNSNVILGGTAANAAEARKAVDLATAFVNGSSGGSTGGSAGAAAAGGATASAAGGSNGGGSGGGNTGVIINNIVIIGKEQVMLRVRVAELQRDVLKQFGIDTRALFSSGGLTVGFLNVNPFTINDSLNGGLQTLANPLMGGVAGTSPVTAATGLGSSFVGNGVQIDDLIKAYERDGLIRTLAEPTLTAISGENAKFLAGGEFPIPVAQDNDRTTIEFKPFGVGLGFTPVVMSEGRISMRITSEVSETTPENAIRTDRLTIPGLKVRRAETTVELPSGGSMVMAGMIQERTKQDLNGIPGVKDLPVLGALFRSRDYLSNETELVVIVTPFIVAPVNENKLTTPLDTLNLASDRQTILWGRLNRMYGVQGGGAKGVYQGNVGFIVE
ncbi:MAG TPA: type II and III secretion system protein family protein [Aestuariivirgaceae bacterium]|nr:type II and III secretion system protein family protein [Aestuariivirgaceae bacterium]